MPAYKRESLSINGIEMGSYDVNIVHPARVMPFDGEVRITDAQGRFDFDLPVSVIEGRVVDEENRPLAGIEVHVGRTAAARDSGIHASSDSSTLADSRTREATVQSRADGSYVLRGVQSDVDLVVDAHGLEFQPPKSAVLRLTAGEVKSGIDMKKLFAEEGPK